MSDYQQQIIQYRRYTLESARDYCGCQLWIEIGEMAQRFTKPLYKHTPVESAAALDELGDVRYFMAEVCTLAGVDLGKVATRSIPTPAMNMYARLCRAGQRAALIGGRLIEYGHAQFIETELGFLLFDLQPVLDTLGTTWGAVEAANLDKLARKWQGAA